MRVWAGPSGSHRSPLVLLSVMEEIYGLRRSHGAQCGRALRAFPDPRVAATG